MVLSHQFPNLYSLDMRKQATVADNFHLLHGRAVRELHFQRNMTDIETTDFISLLGMLVKISLSAGQWEARLWKRDVEGQFLVSSFYNVLTANSNGVVDWKSFWDPLVPPRVFVFCWIARTQNI